MRERSGRQDVPQRNGPNGLTRRANGASATNQSGGERRSQAELGRVWGREAEFTERSRGGSQRSVASGVIDRLIGLWAAELVIVRVTGETERPVPRDVAGYR